MCFRLEGIGLSVINLVIMGILLSHNFVFAQSIHTKLISVTQCDQVKPIETKCVPHDKAHGNNVLHSQDSGVLNYTAVSLLICVCFF